MKKILDFLDITYGNVLGMVLNVCLTIVIFLVLFKLINALFKKAEKKLIMNDSKANVGPLRFIRYLCTAIIGLLCLTSVASYFPAINKLLTSLLAGSGIIALIISIASQDAISNLVGGILILFTKPFKVGDVIRYTDADITGTVEEIALRHTVIRTFENKRLVIPNSIINSSVIENSDYSDSKVCILLDVDITYESDAQKAMEIFADIIRSHPKYFDNRTNAEKKLNIDEPKIRIIKFDSSSIVLRGWIWAENTAAAVDIKSDILMSLKDRYAAENIDFAYPHMVIVPKE